MREMYLVLNEMSIGSGNREPLGLFETMEDAMDYVASHRESDAYYVDYLISEVHFGPWRWCDIEEN